MLQSADQLQLERTCNQFWLLPKCDELVVDQSKVFQMQRGPSIGFQNDISIIFDWDVEKSEESLDQLENSA